MYLAGIPAHIVQRDNNRDACFYSDDDYLFYLEVIAQGLRQKTGSECNCSNIREYCSLALYIPMA